MPTATFDRTATLAAIDEVAGRLIAMVTTAPDPTVRVPATPQWTVAEAFAHVGTVAPRYVQGARQEGEWVRDVGDLADLNARQLAALPGTEVPVVAEHLRAALAGLARLITGFGDRQPVFTFHGGQRIGADVALGVLLGELVVHGHDIAGAVRRPWPIEPAHVELILQGVTPILPGWLAADRARGHTGRYEVRLRGQGVHRFAFDAGRLTMNPAGPWRPDAVISADPAAFLLVTYKRISQWPAVATGRLVAWGRRPWLALSFAGRFHQP
jgi:Mycothiol maleylpyruvate isomerase N-terminal domain